MGSAPRIDKLDENFIINGNMHYWQRGLGLVQNQTVDGSAVTYRAADRYANVLIRAGSNIGFTFSRQTDVPADDSLVYSMRATSNYSTVFGATGTAGSPFYQRIEGTVVSGLQPGQDIYVSFYLKSSISGNIPCALVKNNSIASTDEQAFMWNEPLVANEWKRVYKKITLPAQEIHKGNGISFYLIVGACSGTSWAGYYNATAVENTWNLGSQPPIRNAASTNWMEVAGNWLQTTGVKISTGDHSKFSLAGRSLLEELEFCQRYFTRSGLFDGPSFPDGSNGSIVVMQNYNSGNAGSHPTAFPTTMRAVPILSFWDLAGNAGRWSFAANAGSSTTDNIATSGNSFNITNNMWQVVSGAVVGSGSGGVLRVQWTADAEL